MSEFKANLYAMASVTFCTKADVFAREAGKIYLEESALQRLSAAQWGAVRAMLCRYGGGPELAEKVKAHCEHQRDKALRKDAAADAAAFSALTAAVCRAEALGGEEFADAVSSQVAFWGGGLEQAEFGAMLKRLAVARFLENLARAAAVTGELAEKERKELERCFRD